MILLGVGLLATQIFIPVLWLLLVLPARHHGTLVLLPIGILITTFMISYQRSKAESLGLHAKGGLMERAERMILLGVGLLATQIFIPVLWIMLALTAMTASGRFWRVWQGGARPPPSPTVNLPVRPPRRRLL